MPIGKNAIKRVKNNGYSNVATSAPDMENSIVAEPAGETPELLAEPVKPVESVESVESVGAAKEEKPVKARRGRPPKAKATGIGAEAIVDAAGAAGAIDGEKPVKAKRGGRRIAVKAAAEEKLQKASAKELIKEDAKEDILPKKRGRKPRAAADKAAGKVSVKAGRKEKNGFERVEFGQEMPYWLL